MVKPLEVAVISGDSTSVKALLNDPEHDPNDPDLQRPLLHLACSMGFVEVVKILLQDPRVEVNQSVFNRGRLQTPFKTILSADLDKTLKESLINLLLSHPSLDLSTHKEALFSDLYEAISSSNSVEIMVPVWRKVLATNPELLLDGLRMNQLILSNFLPAPIMGFYDDVFENNVAVALDKLEQVIRELKAYSMFVLAVLMSDGYIKIDEKFDNNDAIRFWMMMSKLPIDLQQVLSYRLYGAKNEVMFPSLLEPVFKDIGKKIDTPGFFSRHLASSNERVLDIISKKTFLPSQSEATLLEEQKQPALAELLGAHGIFSPVVIAASEDPSQADQHINDPQLGGFS